MSRLAAVRNRATPANRERTPARPGGGSRRPPPAAGTRTGSWPPAPWPASHRTAGHGREAGGRLVRRELERPLLGRHARRGARIVRPDAGRVATLARRRDGDPLAGSLERVAALAIADGAIGRFGDAQGVAAA